MIIATVCRSGGDFDPSWVHALRRGLNVWAPKGFRFVALTDMDCGIWRVPLIHEWRGWWAKMELFRPGLFHTGERVLYMDLDTLPVGDLTDLCAYDGPFAVLEDFYTPSFIGSGVMAWTVSKQTEAIYHSYAEDPVTRGRDEHMILRQFPDPDRWQNIRPGQCVSLKPRRGPDPIKHGAPPGARLVCGHGQPRLSDPRAGWAHRLWRDRVNGRRVAA